MPLLQAISPSRPLGEAKFWRTHSRRFLGFLREELNNAPMGETKDLAERINGNCHADEHLSLNYPLTSDGSCPGAFGELIKLA